MSLAAHRIELETSTRLVDSGVDAINKSLRPRVTPSFKAYRLSIPWALTKMGWGCIDVTFDPLMLYRKRDRNLTMIQSSWTWPSAFQLRRPTASAPALLVNLMHPCVEIGQAIGYVRGFATFATFARELEFRNENLPRVPAPSPANLLPAMTFKFSPEVRERAVRLVQSTEASTPRCGLPLNPSRPRSDVCPRPCWSGSNG